jgi:hypothetical protein
MDFKEWLIVHKQFKLKSASDILSRFKRVQPLCQPVYGEHEILEISDIVLSKKNFTMSVKSQLKRAVILWNEYLNFKKSELH